MSFVVVLIAKLATESIGRQAENFYLTHQHAKAAFSTTVAAGLAIPVGWLVIGDRDPAAIAAVLIAVAVTTYRGSQDLERIKDEEV